MINSRYITLHLGIKKEGNDGLLIRLSNNSTTSMISTLNKFAAAPVLISKKNISKTNSKYIFINSGNANACTGIKGTKNVHAILNELAKKLDCNASEIIIMSTGIIGRQLPMTRILRSISSNSFDKYSSLKDAAKSIMTTDKFPKYISKSYNIGSKKIKFKGICKGAGMIEPNMATMLAFIETNVIIDKKNLNKYLKHCAQKSFNSISVDGDMSTNDCLVLTSTNQIEINLMNNSNKEKFLKYASDFFNQLSSLIVKDGEGATKIIKLNIVGSKTKILANKIARKISNSLLVKTAMYGEDPNWGRIIASLGSVQSSHIDIKKVKLMINHITCFDNGISKDNGSNKLKTSMKKKNIDITIDLKDGKYSESINFTDLSHEYVSINSEYTT